MISQTIPNQSDQQQFISHFSPQQEQQLANYIVEMMITPLDGTRISSITQKFHTIQSQVIQVIEQRVKMECQLEIQSLKEKNFQTVCRLYEAVKERDERINELGKRNSQIDLKYLMKVAQVEEIRANYVRVVEELQLEKKRNSKQRNDESEDIGKIQREIISLKQTFKNYFGNQCHSNGDELSLNFSQIKQQKYQSAELLSQQRDKQQNLSEQLRKQLTLLKSHLTLRLQMLQESSQTSDKYQSTQHQLIQRLIEQLIRHKELNTLKVTHQGDNYLSKQLIQDSQLTQKAYLKSKNDLGDILEMELVKMKEKVEKYEQVIKARDSQVDGSLGKIRELEQMLKQKQTKIQNLINQLNQVIAQKSQQNLTHQQSLNQIKLLNQSQYQNIQNLQAQLLQIRQSSAKQQQIQLQKLREEISRLTQANQSLANQKILIKTLNKKLNKEANDANQEKSKVIIERNQLIEQKYKITEQKNNICGEITNLKHQMTLIKQQLNHKTELLQQKQNQIKQLNLQLTIQKDTLTEVENHLKLVQSKLIQSQQSLNKSITSNHQRQHQLQQYQQKQTQLNSHNTQLNYHNSQLQRQVSSYQQHIRQYQQQITSTTEHITNLQHQIKILKLTISQKDKQIQLLTHFSHIEMTKTRQQNIENVQQNQYINQDNLTTSNQILPQQKQTHQSIRQTRIKYLLDSLKTAQEQLQQKHLQLLQNQSSTQKQISIKLNSLSQKQAELSQRELELKNKMEEYQHNFSETRQMFLQEGQKLQMREIQIQHKSNQLNQKQLDIANSLSQLSLVKQQLQQEKLNLQQLRQFIQQSRQQPLSPPPSPFQHPIQSPPDSSSPFKLQPSNKVISNTVSESVRGILSFDDVKTDLKIQKKSEKEFQELENIDQLCRAVADDWMKSEQQKWNLLHYQLDSLAQFVLQADI